MSMSRWSWRIATLAAAAAVVAMLGACSSDDPTSPGSGDVRVYLTDAPIDLEGVSAVNVTFSELTLFPADAEDDDSGEVPVSLEPVTVAGEATVNLLDYRDGEVVLLGVAEQVPEGEYRRIRMGVVAAELVRDDDADPATPEIVEPIDVPSGKIDVPVRFTATAGEGLDVTLDFDAEASVHVNETGGGRYLLRPVVTPVGYTRR